MTSCQQNNRSMSLSGRSCQNTLHRPLLAKSPVQCFLADSESLRPVCHAKGYALKGKQVTALWPPSVCWNRQSVLDRPSGPETKVQYLLGYSELICPVRNALRYAVKGQNAIASGISGLLFSCSPNAVGLRVAQRVFHPFDGVLRRWARPHVAVKGFKRLPFVTDRYSSATVVVIVLVCGIFATRTHLLPHFVFWALRALPVRPIAAPNTAGTSSESQFFAIDDRVFAAIAETVPEPTRLTFFGLVKNSPGTKAFSSEVCTTGIGRTRIAVSHLNLPYRFKVVRAARARERLGCLHLTTNQRGSLSHAA